MSNKEPTANEQNAVIADNPINDVQPQSDDSAVIHIEPQGVSADAKNKKRIVLYNLKQIALLFVAALCTAVALELFLLPGNVVIGGALGIASILDILLNLNASHWYFSAGIWLVAINVPVIIYCFVRFRRRFATKTMLYVLFLAVLLVLLRLLNLAEKFEGLMYGDGAKDKVIYVLLGGALHGVSLPIVMSVNASTGGSDIVALIAQRRSRKSSSITMRIILATNVAVEFVSSLVFGFVTGQLEASINMFIYSVAALFVCEIVQEWIFKGFSSALELEITTEKPQEMAEALQTGLKHGVTTLKVTGGFSRNEKTMIICVVNKSQMTLARKIINQVDPQAFAYVEYVKEVVGKGFANKEDEPIDE